MDGKKNLTEDSALRLNKLLKLGNKAFSYFSLLVKFNQAKTLKERNRLFNTLNSYNKRNPAKVILKNKYQFYSQWYHNTVRELVCMEDFGDDYGRIAKMVQPKLTPKQVKESVNLLKQLKLIKKTKNGYVQTDSIVSTGNEVRSLAVQNFHKQNLQLASDSIEDVMSLQRDISCVVLGLSNTGVKKMKNEIQEFRKRLLKIAEKDTDINKVYHLNMQFFPTTDKVDKGRGK
jgi:uncharacterized protein (TIGR02147 family)